MPKINRKSKARQRQPYLSEKNAWSYYMQSIEPNELTINEAFPDYHPMWLIQSQQKTVSGVNFKLMREHMVRLSRTECAAYLRVDISTLRRWESGHIAVPFIAFELLRLVYENVHFKLSHDSWQGWFVSYEGKLVSPDRGDLSFSPNELSFIREAHQANEVYQSENARLQKENEQLRKELSNNKVVPLKTGNNITVLKEKAA